MKRYIAIAGLTAGLIAMFSLYMESEHRNSGLYCRLNVYRNLTAYTTFELGKEKCRDVRLFLADMAERDEDDAKAVADALSWIAWEN